jgi:hypothetical protein
MKLARWVFTIAGVYGLIVMLPYYFLEARIGHDYPPAITHPEYYYGFTGVTIMWQLVFLVMGRDPARFRPLMWVAAGEKLSFAVSVPVLYLQGRLVAVVLPFAGIDLLLGILFVISWFATAGAAGSPASPYLARQGGGTMAASQ